MFLADLSDDCSTGDAQWAVDRVVPSAQADREKSRSGTLDKIQL